MREQMIEALKNHAKAQIAKHKMNVEIYLQKAVGVGEHSDVVETIDKEMQKITKAKEMLDELSNWRT